MMGKPQPSILLKWWTSEIWRWRWRYQISMWNIVDNDASWRALQVGQYIYIIYYKVRSTICMNIYHCHYCHYFDGGHIESYLRTYYRYLDTTRRVGIIERRTSIGGWRLGVVGSIHYWISRMLRPYTTEVWRWCVLSSEEKVVVEVNI